MGKNLDIKKAELKNIYDDITANGDSLSAIVFNYSEIGSNEINDLRSKLFETDSKFKVIKNTMIRKLFEDFKIELDKKTTSMNALVYTTGEDFTAPIKVLSKFIKDNKKGEFTIGVLDDKLITAEQVLAISKLPSYDILVGQFIGTLSGTTRGLVQTLNGVQSQFTRVLNEISKQQ